VEYLPGLGQFAMVSAIQPDTRARSAGPPSLAQGQNAVAGQRTQIAAGSRGLRAVRVLINGQAVGV